ncbi:MAG: mechanosensitive ion channel family protein [Austwickia sp.]|nr:mechanosensitive ion channel family protein [Austwickia sp.]
MPTTIVRALDLPPVTLAGVGLGVVAIVVAGCLGWAVRRVLQPLLHHQGRSQSSAAVFARLASWVVVALGVSAALTITFPSVKPVDIVGGVGVFSIAAGIAFQTVLGNMFAGIVILGRDKYRVGDQIAVEDYRGTVSAMRLTSATIRTFDGRLVVIPNSILHSKIVTVQTGYEAVRTTVDLDLDDRADLQQACEIAEAAMRALPAVLAEPPPQALLTSVGTATVRVELRFWSGARQLETREAQHQVIREVLRALAREGIPTGSDVQTIDPGPKALELLTEHGVRPTVPTGLGGPAADPGETSRA